MREPGLAYRITVADLRRMSLRRPPRTSVQTAREVIRARIGEPLYDIEGTALLNIRCYSGIPLGKIISLAVDTRWASNQIGL